jgi:uncharacterized protein Smg (DUF494 family)
MTALVNKDWYYEELHKHKTWITQLLTKKNEIIEDLGEEAASVRINELQEMKSLVSLEMTFIQFLPDSVKEVQITTEEYDKLFLN